MSERVLDSIFRKGSTTFFYSSKFFPSDVKKDVTRLYAFVRTADDYVDSIPQQADEFYSFKERYHAALGGVPAGDEIIDSFVELQQRMGFDQSWIDAFFASMEMDITKEHYTTMEEVETYLYGSAEVVGLMMARIMRLPPEADMSARYLGRAYQYINFIRDINEDIGLKRRYFPESDMRACGLTSLDYEAVSTHPEQFAHCVRIQIRRYLAWMERAEEGFSYIPRRYLVPIKTASDMYLWTAHKIYKDPLVVYRQKVKPTSFFILVHGLKNLINPYGKMSIYTNAMGTEECRNV
ncbi:phytoene/squalene synthase family protein [archaeon]|nr:MAG: phytoene/squalene synthase family protein [archaeon]